MRRRSFPPRFILLLFWLLALLPSAAWAQPASIRRGISGEQLRAIQGEPDSVDRYVSRGYEIWNYDLSSVKISIPGDKVVEWDNLSLNLKVADETPESSPLPQLVTPRLPKKAFLEAPADPRSPQRLRSARRVEDFLLDEATSPTGQLRGQPGAVDAEQDAPSLDRFRPPALPSLSRDGVGAGQSLFDARGRSGGIGLFPELSLRNAADRRGGGAAGAGADSSARMFSTPGDPLANERTQPLRRGAWHTYEDAEGGSVGGFRLDAGATRHDIYLDAQGTAGYGTQREAGRATLESYQSPEGDASQTTLDAGRTTYRLYEGADGVRVDQTQRTVRGAAYEDYRRSDGTSVQSASRRVGNSTFRAYDVQRSGAAEGRVQGFSHDAGDATFHQYSGAAGRSQTGVTRRVGGATYETFTDSDGGWILRTTQKIGRVTIHTYTDSDGNSYVETGLNDESPATRNAPPDGP
ncbi:MAG TPA: hypothetical protein VM492_08495 [Sumerlaeia bacterium]|nr:hypothetical protein [Sumerlaeia bacterium]